MQYCLQELQSLIHDPMAQEVENTFDITAALLSQINVAAA